MRREFRIKCADNNKYIVRAIINNFYRYNPIGHAGGKGIFNSHILEKENKDGSTNICFKCTRGKLAECRLLLGKMLNDGVLLGVEEIW